MRTRRRAWALTDRRTPQPRPPRPTGPRAPLRRISQQPEPLEVSFQRIADAGDRRLAPRAQAMLALLPTLEQNHRHRRFWAYTDNADLVFTDTDGPHAGVTIGTSWSFYELSYAMPGDAAPFPGAQITASTKDVEEVDELLEAALGRLFR